MPRTSLRVRARGTEVRDTGPRTTHRLLVFFVVSFEFLDYVMAYGDFAFYLDE